MKTLSVRYSDRPTILDDRDWRWASKYKWHLRGRGYVSRVKCIGRRPDGRTICKTLYLHREILKATKGQQVDHIDRDKLNNRRSNLRFCNNSDNHLNAPKRVRFLGQTPTSKYKGVVRIGVYKRTGLPRFTAKSVNGNNLGYFTSEEEAARAYDKVAYAKSPEFALLNFPNS